MGMLVLLLILASVLWFRYASGGRYRTVVDEALGWGFKMRTRARCSASSPARSASSPE